jgi:hypothetical protein
MAHGVLVSFVFACYSCLLASGSGRANPLNPMFGNWRGMVAWVGVSLCEGVRASQCHGVRLSWYSVVPVSWYRGVPVSACQRVGVSWYRGVDTAIQGCKQPHPHCPAMPSSSSRSSCLSISLEVLFIFPSLGGDDWLAPAL